MTSFYISVVAGVIEVVAYYLIGWWAVLIVFIIGGIYVVVRGI